MENIKLYMDDWLYNAGLVGLYNILNFSNDEISYEDNFIEFNENSLDNFEEKYFKYFLDKYKDILSIYKILEIEEFLMKHEKSNFENFTEKDLKDLNDYINNTLKRYLKSNSYKAAYKLIDSDIDILNLEKNIKTIKLKKKQELVEIIPTIKETFEDIKKILEYIGKEESIKYIGGKNIIYTIIKNSWDGICFLNPQTKEKDMYIDYKNYFISPVIDYMDLDDEKFKYNCITCNRLMKDLSNDLSFINKLGFDVSRKPSHVWDFQNDIAICPICKLVYSCVPAGINYIYDKGIYINDSIDMVSAINTNEKLYQEIYKSNDDSKKLTYRALINALNKENNKNIKYELADIQLVRYENETYKFNILSKNILNIFEKSRKNLDRLVNTGFKEINTNFNIYELVVERLLNGQNMFTLINKLLHYKISKKDNLYYGTGHIIEILKINNIYLEEVGLMVKQEKDLVKLGNISGYYLRENYRQKGSVDKLSGISYRLLNSLKTNNKSSFMDTILNCYLYVKKEVPKIVLDALKSDEEFKTIGYAFVAGLIEGKDNGGEDKNE